MIREKTVFVLGAGASKPFGFPLGGELRDLVLQHFDEGGRGAVDVMNTTPFMPKDIQAFVRALRYSALGSVDAFLERRQEFLDIGKAAMASQLVAREKVDNLFTSKGNWMTYLYARMIGSALEEFGDNQVSFVTFNYDRSLEMFLLTALANSFGKTTKECAAILLDKVPIIHLHGRVGYLPWQSERDSRPYVNNVDVQGMRICMNQIKVVHEDVDESRDRDFQAAKELMKRASRVYFLGFGFGSKNVERLGLSELGVPICEATGLGLMPKEAGECAKLCGNRVAIHPAVDCLDFLRNVADLN